MGLCSQRQCAREDGRFVVIKSIARNEESHHRNGVVLAGCEGVY
jgi:hypothetical protein